MKQFKGFKYNMESDRPECFLYSVCNDLHFFYCKTA